jgi:hypothetical protein
MRNIILLISTALLVSCTKASSAKNKIKQSEPTKLYCGLIIYGCEDVNTNTIEIDITNSAQIKIIRQFHGSDLPITSAFIGKFKNNNEIIATYSKDLTSKNWKQVQDEFPQGEIILKLACDDLKIFKNCKISGEPIDESLKKFPGWEKTYGEVKNLSCNTEQFKTTQASEKECNKDE